MAKRLCARQRKITTAPQAWVDRLVQDAWKPNWQALNIANDDFIRTTEKRHTERVQKFLQSLKDSGHIYAGKYEGPYCVGCEEFKLPGDLIEIDGKKCCPIHSKPIELVNEITGSLSFQLLFNHY